MGDRAGLLADQVDDDGSRADLAGQFLNGINGRLRKIFLHPHVAPGAGEVSAQLPSQAGERCSNLLELVGDTRDEDAIGFRFVGHVDSSIRS